MVRTAGVFFLLSRQRVAEGVDNFLGHEKVFSQTLARRSHPPAGAAQATGRTALGSSRSHSRQWAWSHSLHVGRIGSGSPPSSTSRRTSGRGFFPSYHIRVRCGKGVYESSTFGTRVDVPGGMITEIAGWGNGGGARRCKRPASRPVCG